MSAFMIMLLAASAIWAISLFFSWPDKYRYFGVGFYAAAIFFMFIIWVAKHLNVVLF